MTETIMRRHPWREADKGGASPMAPGAHAPSTVDEGRGTVMHARPCGPRLELE